MEKKRWDCSALPKGWKMEEVTRKSGLSAGKSDVYYFRYCPLRAPTLTATPTQTARGRGDGRGRFLVVVGDFFIRPDRTGPDRRGAARASANIRASRLRARGCFSCLCLFEAAQRHVCSHLAEEKNTMRSKGKTGGRRVVCIVCGRLPVHHLLSV